MIDYLLIGLSGVAGLAAIGGDTWDPTKPNLYRKVTFKGKMVILLIFIAAIASASKQYLEERERTAREVAVKDIVDYQIDMSVDSLLYPIRLLYMDIHNGTYLPNDDIKVHWLLSPGNLKKFESACLGMIPQNIISVPYAPTWGERFESGIKSGVDRLEKLVDKFAHQMDPALLTEVHSFLETGALIDLAHGSDKQAVEDRNLAPRCLATIPAKTYKSYLDAIRDISKAKEAAN